MTQLALINNDDIPQVEATDYIPKEVAFVKPFEQQLAAIEGEFSKFVFDYSNKDDNDKARSLIRKLQKSRVAIEKVGKAERDPALKYQRHVIAEEDKLTARVQKLIDQYEKPLKEWEAKDQKRKDEILARIAAMRPTAEWVLSASSSSLRAHLSLVEATDPDDGFDEFSSEAFAQRITTIDYLKEHVAIAEKREADAAELEALRAAAEERRLADEAAAAKAAAELEEAARIEREAKAAEEARIAEEKRAKDEADRIHRERNEAAAKATADAAAAAEAARLEAETREKVLKDQLAAQEVAAAAAAQKAIDDAAAAKKAADDQAAAAVAAEQKRIAAAAAAQKAIDDAREADREHRAKINREVLAVLIDIIANAQESADEQGKAIITAVALGKIPHLKILY